MNTESLLSLAAFLPISAASILPRVLAIPPWAEFSAIAIGWFSGVILVLWWAERRARRGREEFYERLRVDVNHAVSEAMRPWEQRVEELEEMVRDILGRIIQLSARVVLARDRTWHVLPPDDESTGDEGSG